MPQESTHIKATAGAEGNNCLLHCIAHSLFSLPVTQLEQIAQLPAFDLLMNTFRNHYGLSKKPNLEMILSLNRELTSPYDIEAIWGPVFRELLLQLPEIQEKFSIDAHHNGFIPDEAGAILAQMLGASLTVHHSYPGTQGPINYPLAENEIYHIDVYHTQKGGGHYDFDFPNDVNDNKALKHNNDCLSKKSKVHEACKNIDSVSGRKERIKKMLENELNWMNAQQKGVRVEIPLRPSKPQFELKVKSKPIPKNSENTKTTEENIEATYSKTFFDKLAVLFPKEQWQHTVNENNLNITHNTDKTRQVNIVKNVESNEVSFKSGMNNIEDMLRCAMAYQETMAPDSSYELTVSTKEQAKTILLKMKETGFDIKKLDTVIVGHEVCAGKDLEKLMHETFLDHAPPEPESTTRTRPGKGGQ